MLYSYKEAIQHFGSDYNLKKAILSKLIFKIEKGIYSDGESNFSLIEVVMKKYSRAFLVKESALHYIGFIKEEPSKIHIGTARNALRIKDGRIQQHFYSNLNMAIIKQYDWLEYGHILSYENIKRHITENGNEIRILNLKALFFDILRNHKHYKQEELFELFEKFKNCRYFYDLEELELGYNLQYENIVDDIEFFEEDLYEELKGILDEVWYRKIKMELDY